MNKVKKWLDANGIQYTYTEKGNSKYIDIILESGCVWVNGFNENMYYDKSIRIYQDTYKNYVITETYDYNLTKTIKKNTKADIIIEALEERFKSNL